MLAQLEWTSIGIVHIERLSIIYEGLEAVCSRGSCWLLIFSYILNVDIMPYHGIPLITFAMCTMYIASIWFIKEHSVHHVCVPLPTNSLLLAGGIPLSPLVDFALCV